MKLLSLNVFNTLVFAYHILAFQFPNSQSECGLLNTLNVSWGRPILHTFNNVQFTLSIPYIDLTLFRKCQASIPVSVRAGNNVTDFKPSNERVQTDKRQITKRVVLQTYCRQTILERFQDD